MTRKPTTLMANNARAHERQQEEDQRVEALLLAEAPFRTFLVENPLVDRALHVPPLLRLGPGRIEWALGNADDGWWRDGWRADRAQASEPLPSPRLSCLNQFIRLADDPDERRFLLFAQRYGVLGLCPVPEGERFNGVRFGDPSALEHWYPGVRDKGVPPRVDPDATEGKRWYWEPIAGWRAYAREARAILRMAQHVRIHGRKEPLPSDNRLSQYNLGDAESSLHEVVASFAHNWLKNAGITVTLSWLQGQPARLVLSTGGAAGPSKHPQVSGLVTDPLAQLGWPLHNLFGTLALQLAGALCADDRLVQCARCGTIFMHEGAHRPRRDQPYYCGVACRQAARKEDKREWAARKRAEKKSVAVTDGDSHADSQDE